MSGPIDLEKLSAKLKRPMKALYVLADSNDPFGLHQPYRQERAHWFAEIWQCLDLEGRRIHLRAIHYRIISQDKPVALPNGENYENTPECWHYLIDASRDARY